MQLSKTDACSLRKALTLATAALLASPVAAENNGVELQFGQLYYSERDRVDVNTSQVSLKKTLQDGDVLKLGFTYDAMTGASPNGRLIPLATQNQPVPITTASGFSFSTQAGKTASTKAIWLTEFKDTRRAGTLDWEHALSRDIAFVIGGNLSRELDYNSLGATTTVNAEFNDKRTTMSLGASISQDLVDPRGGIPNGLGVTACGASTSAYQPTWINCGGMPTRYKAGEKISNSFFLGTTQVWNRQTLAQVTFTHTIADGYLTDPYKQLSVTHDSFGGEIAVVYEKRPSQRSSNSVFLKTVHTLDNRSINSSYRFFWDDWSIKAHTFDFHARLDLDSQWYVQPHARFSIQSDADFFTTHLKAESNKPNFASADHRLSDQTTVTIGLKAGVRFNKLALLALRIEKMNQQYRSANLPNLEAWIVQMTFQNEF